MQHNRISLCVERVESGIDVADGFDGAHLLPLCPARVLVTYWYLSDKERTVITIKKHNIGLLKYICKNEKQYTGHAFK